MKIMMKELEDKYVMTIYNKQLMSISIPLNKGPISHSMGHTVDKDTDTLVYLMANAIRQLGARDE